MGLYVNRGNEGFKRALRSEYIDKSGMISVINDTLGKENFCSCITRCRRFGKSMAADMLRAYYDMSCDSYSLFKDLEISKDTTFKTYLNQFPVIHIDITEFTTSYKKDDNIVAYIEKEIKDDIIASFPQCHCDHNDRLLKILYHLQASLGKKFIMIIDEWDAILREFRNNRKIIDEYIDMLRNLFKSTNSKDIFYGVYITGILPIKKYKTQSALNNFTEYSMIQPRGLAKYFGFTRNEVLSLCQKFDMDYKDLELWYDGYKIGDELSIFNPNSVIMALTNKECSSYWGKSADYELIVDYIRMNFDGLKDDIIEMISGGKCKVDTGKFSNDMDVIHSKDDVLTCLIHLGYLSYDKKTSECSIPNKEVLSEFVYAIEDTGWSDVIESIHNSEKLLEATLCCDESKVAVAINRAHDKNTSILSYNDENSLACVVCIAYYCAKDKYIMHRELATGKGFADIIFIPRQDNQLPAIIVELKCNKSADDAIAQIKRNGYIDKISEYTSQILLVGINYDKKSKKHTCRIERSL